MAQIVNLKTARKQAARATARAKATANAAQHGRTKAARDLERAVEEKAKQDLDAHRREPD